MRVWEYEYGNVSVEIGMYGNVRISMGLCVWECEYGNVSMGVWECEYGNVH